MNNYYKTTFPVLIFKVYICIYTVKLHSYLPIYTVARICEFLRKNYYSVLD